MPLKNSIVIAKRNPTKRQDLQQTVYLLFLKFWIGRGSMSRSPNFILWLRRIGNYLEKVEVKGKKEQQELKLAQEAFEKICETLYGVYSCPAGIPRQSPNTR
jgi:hypothetical protein